MSDQLPRIVLPDTRNHEGLEPFFAFPPPKDHVHHISSVVLANAAAVAHAFVVAFGEIAANDRRGVRNKSGIAVLAGSLEKIGKATQKLEDRIAKLEAELFDESPPEDQEEDEVCRPGSSLPRELKLFEVEFAGSLESAFVVAESMSDAIDSLRSRMSIASVKHVAGGSNLILPSDDKVVAS